MLILLSKSGRGPLVVCVLQLRSCITKQSTRGYSKSTPVHGVEYCAVQVQVACDCSSLLVTLFCIIITCTYNAYACIDTK
jgi:hypothetical protein